ncbi:xylulokinase [bacterium]|nr:xylulokinase [bacterium]
MSDLFLGIDCGTQGSKVLIVDRGKRAIVAEAYATHELIEDNLGKREQEPRWWIAAISTAIKSALQGAKLDPKNIRAIGVSGQQHGFVPLDKKGEVIRPAKLWCDTATAAEAEAMTQRLGGEAKVVDLIGNSIAVGFTASKIEWLKLHEPANYERLATLLLPHDYINFWLTGERKTEPGDASGTAYYDVRQRKWSKEVLRAIDASGKLEECLPELVSAEAPVGKIRADIAQQFGFDESVLVSSGGGDNMMAAIGTGNVSAGVVTASLGTSGTIYCFAEKPVVDPQGELAAFCSSDGHWLPLVCTMNVTVATELTRELFNLDIATLNKDVAQTAVGAEGLLLLPYFNGERTPPLPHGRATLFGMSSTNYTRANVCRAAMEGATFGLRYGLDVLARNGITPGEIRLVGGGAKSKVWRQMVADVFGCPVVCPVTQEAGALGAALQALWCYSHAQGEKLNLKAITDEFVSLDSSTSAEPQAQNVNAYNEIYARYLKLDQQLRPLFQ